MRGLFLDRLKNRLTDRVAGHSIGLMTDETHGRLVLIPGLGVDEGLFAPQREAFPQIECPSWIEHHHGESLRSYAHRLAATIEPGGPMVLGGQSFGGMLALEIARVLQPRAVILIASCRSAKSIPAPFWWLEAASRLMSDKMARRIVLAQTSAIVWRLGCSDEATRRFLEQRLSDASISFIRWAVHAIRRWTFDARLPMPVYHIHGQRDRLIPVKNVNADVEVAGAGHLLNMTHREQVNSFIRDCLERTLTPRTQPAIQSILSSDTPT